MNKSDLRHYEKVLIELRERTRAEIPRMMETVLSDDIPPGEHDRAVSESADKELVLEQAEEGIRSQVVAALARLADGTFGRCLTCGNPIPKARLDLIPYTPYCVACEEALEKR